MAREATKLVIGSGEVYFDRFLPGTRIGEGERYIGNTPSFRIERSVERLERATSYRGRRIATPGATIAEENSANFTTDHIDIENLGMWFGNEPRAAFTPPSTGVSETFPVKRGRTYQLGKTVEPFGLHNIAYPYVYLNGAILNQAGNYRIDFQLGRIEILSSAPDVSNGDSLTVQFWTRVGDGLLVHSEPVELLGSLRFIARNSGNRHRTQNDIFFPMVSITPRGQVDMKTDEWQQWSFDANAMNLRPGVEQVYVLRRSTVIGNASDEQAIIDEFGSLVPFPYWDDQLHQIQNYDWPPAVDFTGV